MSKGGAHVLAAGMRDKVIYHLAQEAQARNMVFGDGASFKSLLFELAQKEVQIPVQERIGYLVIATSYTDVGLNQLMEASKPYWKQSDQSAPQPPTSHPLAAQVATNYAHTMHVNSLEKEGVVPAPKRGRSKSTDSRPHEPDAASGEEVIRKPIPTEFIISVKLRGNFDIHQSAKSLSDFLVQSFTNNSLTCIEYRGLIRCWLDLKLGTDNTATQICRSLKTVNWVEDAYSKPLSLFGKYVVAAD